jgi:hypothetical protein
MKRAIALLGAMMALLFIGASSASAACVAPYCPAPSVSATGATGIGAGNATLNGSVNTNGGNAATWSITFNGSVVGSGSIPDGTSPVAVSASVAGLTASSTYSYTVSITNTAGTQTASTTFTTASLPPAPTPEPTPAPTPTPTTSPSTTPATTPTAPNNTSPSSNPTSTAPTAAEKRAAASAVSSKLGDKNAKVTYKSEVGGALVFSVAGAKANKKTGTPVLALSIPEGAKLKAEVPTLKVGGKSITPKVTTKVSKDGTAVVSVKLTNAQQAALTKAGKTSFKVTITVTGADGKPAEKSITVKLPKKGK